MFLEFFGLHEQPFGVTPDPRFLHLGAQYREALASLIYGIETNRGFLALVAPPGMGKTSLLFQFLEGLRNRAHTAFIFQTGREPRELLRYILADLGVDAAGKDLPAMHAILNQVLMDDMNAGRRFVLVIDEAQNLEEKVLESVRLLSNFETPWMKLMQIVIAGQPQLAERLTRPSMAQLRQRISAIVRLEPFSPDETASYIAHRLWVAGYDGPSPFTVGARLLITEQSDGIPRNINNLCFNAMSLAYATGTRKIDSNIVREVIADLELESLAPTPERQCSGTRAPVRRPMPFGSMLGMKMERSWRIVPAMFATAAVLVLSAALGFFWNTRAGIAGTVKAGLRHLTIASANTTRPRTAEQTNPQASSIEPQVLETSAARPEAADQVLTVVVPPGATLRHLSLLYLGRSDFAALMEICALNPDISDASHIEAGRRLRLPLYLRRNVPGTIETAAEVRAAQTHEERP
jgi:type II secretory pathway predicted ATPase ExeA